MRETEWARVPFQEERLPIQLSYDRPCIILHNLEKIIMLSVIIYNSTIRLSRIDRHDLHFILVQFDPQARTVGQIEIAALGANALFGRRSGVEDRDRAR